MPIQGESAAVQKPLIRYAKEAGWAYLSPTPNPSLKGGAWPIPYPSEWVRER